MNTNLESNIIFEDKDILVLNKPYGVVVNRSESATETVQDWLSAYLKIGPEDGELMNERLGLAHRLDKETSGVLMVGKNEKTLEYLMGLFANRKIFKSYIALVHGKLEPREGTVKLPMKRDTYYRDKFVVHYEGKKAETSWEVVGYGEYEGEVFTLVKLFPKTGRTHQIRVHMTHLKHPLFGDERYLSDNKRKKDRSLLQRHFLHAYSIEFKDMKGVARKFEAPLPVELSKVLEKVGIGIE